MSAHHRFGGSSRPIVARTLVGLVGLSIGMIALAAPQPGLGADSAPLEGTALYLRAGIINLATPAREARLETSIAAAGAGKRFVIQLDSPLTPEKRQSLEQAGIVLGDYLPANAYIVRLDRADAAAAAGLNFVRWSGEFTSQWKVDPEVGRNNFATKERRELVKAGQAALTITLFSDATEKEIASVDEAIAGLPGAMEYSREKVGANQTVTVRLGLADLGAVASLAGVQFIEEAPEIIYRNDTDRWIVQSNITNVTPVYDHGIHGEGQVLGHVDGKPDRNHCSFLDAVNPIGAAHRKILAYNGSAGTDQHGTHTAGTAVGDNGDNSATRGVAYLAKMVTSAIPSLTESGINTTFTTQHGQGARVFTNSWGNDGTTAYDGLCRGVDNFSYNNEDDLVCFAVSNLSTLKNPENAKNLLAVGADQDTPNQGNFCSGGTGPTSDGGRKPEIYAPGCGTVSSRAATACGTIALTGTSMASPAIAGSGLLVRQYYSAGYYPSGAANASDAFTPSGALIKATLLNSATDMTGISGFPSNQEGWGRVLLDNTLMFPGDPRQMKIVDVRNAQGLSTGGLATQTVNLSAWGAPLKVTLVWTDPPAAAGAAAAAINDLDLQVISPSNVTYLGNVFAAGVSTTGGVKDAKNNVEQVLITAPEAGTWTVKVNAAAVNVNLQGYALVINATFQVSLPCPADLNGDGTVGDGDLSFLLGSWGGVSGPADLDGDHTIGALDLAQLLGQWGPCP